MTQPGLDLHTLRALRRPHPAQQLLPGRIRAHLDAHDGYVALSGGKDSLVVLHLTLQVELNVPVVFFDSGLEFPETYAYLELLKKAFDLQLTVVPARPPLLDVLVASGAWDHAAPDLPAPDLHDVLIAQPAAAAHAEFGPGELWGSGRRRRAVEPPCTRPHYVVNSRLLRQS